MHAFLLCFAARIEVSVKIPSDKCLFKPFDDLFAPIYASFCKFERPNLTPTRMCARRGPRTI